MKIFSRHRTRGEINIQLIESLRTDLYKLQSNIDASHTHSSDGVHKSNPGQCKLSLTEFPFAVLLVTLKQERAILSGADAKILRSWY